MIDIAALQRTDITATENGYGVLAVTQHKTGVPVAARLYPETMMAIAAICNVDEPRVFWGLSHWHMRKTFPAIVRAAGLQGASKMLRKSGATSVHAENPGAAMGYLGHLTPGLGFKHYIDLSQAATNKPMPRRLIDEDTVEEDVEETMAVSPATLTYNSEPMTAGGVS